MRTADLVSFLADPSALILIHLLLYGTFGLAIARKLLGGGLLYRTNAGIRALGRAIAQRLRAAIRVGKNSGIPVAARDCCTDTANLGAPERTGVDGETVRRCKVCGSRHFSLTLESGTCTLIGSTANLTVKRGEKSMAALYVMFGVATALFTFTIQVAGSFVNYKVILTIVDYGFLVYLFFFNSWFRDCLLRLFARIQEERD